MATVARHFGISPSVLHKGVAQGFLSWFERLNEYHRPGLTERVIRKFIAALAAESEASSARTILNSLGGA
jgi:hypothetical protein